MSGQVRNGLIEAPYAQGKKEKEHIMSTDIIKGEYKVVPISSVIHDEDNARRGELPNIEELAADIKSNGLINPLTVTNGGDKYVVRAGNRRLAALKSLKVKEVPVIVIPNDDIEVVQLAENLGREDLHPLDVAQRLFDLIDKKGAYGGKYTTKQMAEKLGGKSVSHVENLVRVNRKLSDEVKTALRETKFKPSLSVLFAWAPLEEADQMKAFKKWLAQQEKIAAHGRKRGGSGEEGEGEGGGKKAKGEGASELKKGQQKFYEPIKETLAWKVENTKGVTEKARYEGALELLNFMFGEAKRLTLVNAADMKAAAKAAEAEAEAEEAEAEESEEGEE